ncbi:MAG TPA: hypothetical protein VGH50_01425 [Candidatus Binatia bacterium]
MPFQRSYRELTTELSERARQNYRLAKALPEFLRERIAANEAEERIRRLLADREQRFLDLARTRIYSSPASPYLKLLRIAGCEFADLDREVRRDGLDAALAALARRGVYLTVEEYKGKMEVRRGGESFRIASGEFVNPDSPPGFATQSSGTNNAPMTSIISLDRVAVQALELAMLFSAHDLWKKAHALYDAILPSGSGLRNLLMNAKLGVHAERWFARRVPDKSGAGAWYNYLATHFIVAIARRNGACFPRPEFIDIGDLTAIVRWISAKRSEGRGCSIKTTGSNAARVAQAAEAMSESLQGVTFICGSEPFTEAKRDVILRTGATATPHYGFVTGGSVGYGCGRPIHTDEIHVNRHTMALIAAPDGYPLRGGSIRPFLFTSLLASDPRLLFNVENGDYGILEERHCGCAMERAGLTLHLHGIRSYEKFTSEGMNFFYGDLFEIFEKQLPAEFGGGPGDYQLAEEEDGDGRTRLTLRVDPKVGELDEARLIARLRQHLGAGSWQKEFQVRVWDNAGTFRIARVAPHASPRGKILPLELSRSSRS